MNISLQDAWEKRFVLRTDGKQRLHESDARLAEGKRLFDEGEQSRAYAAKISGNGKKLRAESERFNAAGDLLVADGFKIQAEGELLMANGFRLQAEGDKLWIEAIMASRGNVELEWIWNELAYDYDCILGTGEHFSAKIEQPAVRPE